MLRPERMAGAERVSLRRRQYRLVFMSSRAGSHECSSLEAAIEQWRSGDRTTALLSAGAAPAAAHSDRAAHWRILEHLGCDSRSRRRSVGGKASDAETETELLEALYALGSPTAAFHLASRIGDGPGGPDLGRRDDLIAFAIAGGCPAAAELLDIRHTSAARRVPLLRAACWNLLSAEWGMCSPEETPTPYAPDLEPDALFSRLAYELAEALPAADGSEALLWCRRVEACAADPAEGAINANLVRLHEATRWKSVGMTDREEATLRVIDSDAAAHAVGQVLLLNDEHKIYRYDYQDAVKDIGIWTGRLNERARWAWRSGDRNRAITLVGCLLDLGTYEYRSRVSITEIELLNLVSPHLPEVSPDAPYVALDWLTRQLVPALADVLDHPEVSTTFALLPPISTPADAHVLADAWRTNQYYTGSTPPDAGATQFNDAVMLLKKSVIRPKSDPGPTPEQTVAALDQLGLGVGDRCPDVLFDDHHLLLNGRLAASQPLWLSLCRRVLLDTADSTGGNRAYVPSWNRAWKLTSQAVYSLMETTLHRVLSDGSAAGGQAFNLYLNYLKGFRPRFEEVVIPPKLVDH